MSGCVECNSDGFAEGETKSFDFIYQGDSDGKNQDVEFSGDITRDGDHYYIDCTTKATWEDGTIIIAGVEGQTNNARCYLPMLGIELYQSIEDEGYFEAILDNAK